MSNKSNLLNTIISLFLTIASLTICNGQNFVTLAGLVSDKEGNPLNNATLIAKPIDTILPVAYTISDTNGNYALTLEKDIYYKVALSHLGFKTLYNEVVVSENTSNFNFVLDIDYQELDEVVIKYDYQPIIKSKDTITYNLKAFTTGNEFKMREVLENLPGISISENVIKVQGKSVTKLLVEGKPFFGGSTKLAIENIPADVMDKIEIISNYKETELIENLADNEDLALNVVLKEDRKNFAFGNIEGGVGMDLFYRGHASVFKYKPNSNFSVIGDINNFNTSSLELSDLTRLVGGVSNLFSPELSNSNIINNAISSKDRFQSITRFTAGNFSHQLTEKSILEGFAIYSNNDIQNKSASFRNYLGDNPVSESREESTKSDDCSSLVNLKWIYNPRSTKRWVYNFNYLNAKSLKLNQILSQINDVNSFETDKTLQNDRYSNLFEGYFKVGKKYSMGLAFRQERVSSLADDDFLSNQILFENSLPVIEDSIYQINQAWELNTDQYQFLFKNYWLAHKYFHLFYNLSINHKTTDFSNNLSQKLASNESLYFEDYKSGLGLNLSDANITLGIKTRLGKLEGILEVIPHQYFFEVGSNKKNFLFVEPRFNLNFQMDDDEEVDFEYKFSNRFFADLDYLAALKLLAFNSVFLGNPNLVDEEITSIGLYYSNYKKIDKFFLDASIDYSIGNPIRNLNVLQNRIDQISTPFLLSLPEKSLSINSELGLVYNKASLEFGFDLDWLGANQLINNEVFPIDSYELEFRTKWMKKFGAKTRFQLKHAFSLYNVVSDFRSNSSENVLSLQFQTEILNRVVFKTDFSGHLVSDFEDDFRKYFIQNIYLGYSIPNNPWSFSLNANNLYNNGLIVRNYFSENLITSNQIFTLPRVLYFEMIYRF